MTHESRTVKNWMTPDPVTITPETTLPEAMSLMKSGGFRRLPVIKGGDLVGIVTDRDLREAMPSDATSLSIWEINFLLARLQVKEIMSKTVLTVPEDAWLERAAQLMLEHKIGGMPVVRGTQLVGIITVTDVLEAFIERDARAKPS
jgi:acetoin utilization protein AcuB